MSAPITACDCEYWIPMVSQYSWSRPMPLGLDGTPLPAVGASGTVCSET
jgi:hypothetical protein